LRFIMVAVMARAEVPAADWRSFNLRCDLRLSQHLKHAPYATPLTPPSKTRFL
jgi:hypothetical protein